MQCDKIPAPIGPFSVGKMIMVPGVGTWAYASGQLGLDPKTAELVNEKPAKQAK